MGKIIHSLEGHTKDFTLKSKFDGELLGSFQ